ncbi:hypothetical protein HMPREF6745_1900 [Prevotella sp. oral taxon 472 str. F0295]|nr:hypothetical protein HMPREF6745_1900 [Prevotella sp. oral taxon 472 str. F0295]
MKDEIKAKSHRRKPNKVVALQCNAGLLEAAINTPYALRKQIVY